MRVGPINMSKSMQFFLYVGLWPFLHTTREEISMNQDTEESERERERERERTWLLFFFICDTGHFSCTLTSVYMSVCVCVLSCNICTQWCTVWCKSEEKRGGGRGKSQVGV